MSARTALFVCLVTLAAPAGAQKHAADDALPVGAKGKVLPISGRVLELRGLASGVSGKQEALNAALRDLGAKATPTEIRIELSADVLFDFDKADLRPEATPSLEKLVTILKHPMSNSGPCPRRRKSRTWVTPAAGGNPLNLERRLPPLESTAWFIRWRTGKPTTFSSLTAKCCRPAAPADQP